MTISWFNRSFAAALAATIAAGGAFAEEAAGDWNGLLAGQLHIVVHVAKDADGHYGATLESPDQGSFVLPADQVVVDADHLGFRIPRIGGSYAGTWNADLKDFDNGHDANGEVINAGVYILKALAAEIGRAHV